MVTLCRLPLICFVLLHNFFPIAAFNITEIIGWRFLKSSQGVYLRSICSSDNDNEVEMSEIRDKSSLWYIDEYLGKIALVPYCAQHKYLYSKYGDWIGLSHSYFLWQPINNNDNSWTFFDRHRTLGFKNNGPVYAESVYDEDIKWNNHFWLEQSTGLSKDAPPISVAMRITSKFAGIYCIKTPNERHLFSWWSQQLDRSGWSVGLSENCGECGQWHIEDHHGQITLKEFCSGKYLHALENKIVVLSDGPHNSMWKPLNDYGRWAFQSEHGFLVVPKSGQDVHVNHKASEKYNELELKLWTGDIHISARTTNSRKIFIYQDKMLELTSDYWADELAGKYFSITSIYGSNIMQSYENNAEMSKNSDICALWYIQKQLSKITLQPVCMHNDYLYANEDGFIGINKTSYMWEPRKNKDNSWTFVNYYYGRLAASENGSMYISNTNNKSSLEDKFWLEPWTGEIKNLEPPQPIGHILSAEAAGKYYIQHKNEKKYLGVRMANMLFGAFDQCGKCEQWYIEDHYGKVALKNKCFGKYLGMTHQVDGVAFRGETFDLVDNAISSLWIPLKYQDVWMFKGENGWLGMNMNTFRMKLHVREGYYAKFYLIPWTEPFSIFDYIPHLLVSILIVGSILHSLIKYHRKTKFNKALNEPLPLLPIRKETTEPARSDSNNAKTDNHYQGLVFHNEYKELMEEVVPRQLDTVMDTVI